MTGVALAEPNSGTSANDALADIAFRLHVYWVKQQSTKISGGVRVLFGLVGIAMLISAAQEVWVGEFNNHGTLIKMNEQPIAFWLLIAFKAVLGVAGVYALVFGIGKEAN